MSVTLPVHIVISPELMEPERLDALMERLADFEPLLVEIGGLLEEANAENFETEGFGTWADLAPSTWKERFRSGHGVNRMLVRTGALQAALTERGAPGHKFLVSENSVCVGVYGDVIPYAYWLQTGTRRMPGRVLVQVRPDTIDKIIAAVTDWLGGGEGVQVLADAPLTAF